VWTAKTELSENADFTSNKAVTGSIAGVIEACAQDSKKVRKKPGNANASFDIRCLFPSIDADLFSRFRDTKNEGCRKRYQCIGRGLSFISRNARPQQQNKLFYTLWSVLKKIPRDLKNNGVGANVALPY